jgi:hypothetical protein
MASRDAFAVGVVGKKQLQDEKRVRSLLLRSELHQTPKISDYHAAHCVLAPSKVKQVAAKQ